MAVPEGPGNGRTLAAPLEVSGEDVETGDCCADPQAANKVATSNSSVGRAGDDFTS
jgi:hypothetical protein